MTPFLLPLLALTATVLFGLLLVRLAVPLGFIDLPGDRKVHTLPTPRTGGLAMVLGGGVIFGLALALGWLPWPVIPWQTWLAGFGFITVGAADDRFSFQPRQKVLVLLALSALAAWPWVLVLMLVLKSTSVPWLPAAMTATPLFLGGAAILLTFWFMAVPNAVNIEDAINGYMGGFTFIILFGLALRGVDTRLALGALLGFLLLNWPKARHFMGDAGSFGCGFFIAEAILRGGGLVQPTLALFLTAPISLDVAMGLVRRKRLGMTFFTADRSTCPHHLLALTGGNILLTTALLWLNAAGFVLLANRPWWALGQAVLYVLALIFLNRKLLKYPFTQA
jgi:UDP-GlcNAc:undecaprenyl-phosphate GlcNAc-1-phosphate transferase